MPTTSKIYVDQIWDNSGLNKIVDVQESWLYPESFNFAGDVGSVSQFIVDTLEALPSPVANGTHGAQGSTGGYVKFLSPILLAPGTQLDTDLLYTRRISRDNTHTYAGVYFTNDTNDTMEFKNESNILKASIQLNTGTFYTTGNILAEGDVTSEYTSDERLKNVVSTLENTLESIRKIEPIKYQWNELANEKFNYNTNEIELGFKAQQIEKYFPELVTQRGNTEFLKLDYQKMTVVLLSALQELDKKVQELEKRLEEK